MANNKVMKRKLPRFSLFFPLNKVLWLTFLTTVFYSKRRLLFPPFSFPIVMYDLHLKIFLKFFLKLLFIWSEEKLVNYHWVICWGKLITCYTLNIFCLATTHNPSTYIWYDFIQLSDSSDKVIWCIHKALCRKIEEGQNAEYCYSQNL